MLKKIICLLVIFSMALSAVPSFAQSGENSFLSGNINRDTVITQDNINSILKHYGIDPKTAIKSKSADNNTVVTVGQLEDALKAFAQQPKQITINETVGNNNELTTKGISSESIVGVSGDYGWFSRSYWSEALSRTSYPSSNNWGLSHSVTGNWTLEYYWTDPGHTQWATRSYWTSSSNPSVSLVTQYNLYIGVTNYKLESINSISSSSTSTTIIVELDNYWKQNPFY